MGDDLRIRSYLATVRRRLRWRQLTGEVTVALAAGAALLLVELLAVDGGGAGALRALRVVVELTALALALVLAAVVARPLLRWRGDESVARLVGARSGAGDQLLSAVQLSRALSRPAERPLDASPSLARAHLSETARRTALWEPRRVAPWLPSRRRLIAAALIAVAYVGLLIALRARVGHAIALLRAATAPAPAPSADPIVGDLELHLELPPHMALPARDIPGSSGEIVAPRGTRVSVRARPLVPARAARLLLEDPAGALLQERPARLADGRIEAELVVDRAGGYRFVLEQGAPPAKGAARSVREPEAHRIEIEVDKAPRVTLVAPADELDLDGPRPVELSWSAEDDFGLGDVDLVWSGPETSGATPRIEGRMSLRKAAAGRGASGRIEWDVGQLALPPGVRITYHVQARDNDAISGPNVGVSRSHSLRIYSAAEKHDDVLAAEQALVERAVELLADRLEAVGGTGDAPLGTQAAAHARTADLLEQLAALRALVDRDPLSPRDLRLTLAGIAQRVGRLQHEEAPALQALRSTPADADTRRAAEAVGARQVAELERDIILLDDFLGRQRIEQMLSLTDQMQRARDRLRSLLADYQRTQSDGARAEIEREITAIEQKLAELAQRARKLAHEVPDEYVNREALRGSEMKDRLERLRDLVRRGEIERALDELKRLSSDLDRMAAGLEGDLRDYRDDRFSAEDRALAELEDKVGDLEHDERELQHETEGAGDRHRDEARRVAREHVEPFLQRAREQVAEMKRRLAGAERDQLSPEQQESFDRVRRRVDDTAEALEHGDLEPAGAAADQAAKLMHGLSFELRIEEERRWAGGRAGLRKARERIDESEPVARRLADEIAQIMPRPGELLGPDARSQMERLAARQDAVRQRADELRKELERRTGQRAGATGERPRGSPGAAGAAGAAGEGADGTQPGGHGAGLRAASDHMGRASQSLRAGNPRDSAGEAGQASDQLARLRRDIQNERRPRRSGGGGRPNQAEPVRIPGGDEFRAPREFRQDLLDAMKRESPREYREQVRRYYEELVK